MTNLCIHSKSEEFYNTAKELWQSAFFLRKLNQKFQTNRQTINYRIRFYVTEPYSHKPFSMKKRVIKLESFFKEL